MYSITVVPTGSTDPADQLGPGPGDTLQFGRGAPAAGRRHLDISHPGVFRTAGEVTACGTSWTLSTYSRASTYVVDRPEGAGEHVKIAPGRAEAPIPFELSRVVLPAGGELLSFDVWAPRHDYVQEPEPVTGGERTALAFPLDHAKRYFLVLVARCELRPRREPHAPLPTVEQIAEQLQPARPGVNRAAVQWNIDYPALKMRLKTGPESAHSGARLNNTKEALVSFALRFDLVHEEDLAPLRAPAAR